MWLKEGEENAPQGPQGALFWEEVAGVLGDSVADIFFVWESSPRQL